MTSNLSSKHCKTSERIEAILNPTEANLLKQQLKDDWTISADRRLLQREFIFSNFYETMSFVNALAWIANGENHHPDLAIGYDYCRVTFMTHSANGLTENDFICAAKCDLLLNER